MLFTFFTVLTFATVFEKAMWVKLHLSTYQGSGLKHDILYLRLMGAGELVSFETILPEVEKITFLNLNPWFQDFFNMLCNKWEVLKNIYATM